MAIQVQGSVSGVAADVGGSTFKALHVHFKPLEYGALGHYRTNHRCVMVNAQAANSRLFEIRNSHATNLLIPTRLIIRWFSITGHTALIEDSIDVFKCTSFSVVDTTNTVTPSASAKRTDTMAAAPGNAVIRGVTVAGAAAGMTGGTLTKDGTSIGQLPSWLNQTAYATTNQFGVNDTRVLDVFDDVNGTHPFCFKQNEGFIIENRVLLGAAAGSSVYIDCSWAEVVGF